MNLSIAQSYMLCALNENGKLPALSNEVPACLVAGGILDLILEEVVTVTDKKAQIIAPLSERLEHLQSLYDFLVENDGIKLTKLVSDYCFSFSNKKVNALTSALGHSLVQQQCVSLQEGSLLGKKVLFVPSASAVDGTVQRIRAELLEEGLLSDEIVALAALLAKSKMLKQYFSDYEKETLKARLKEIKHTPEHKMISELLEYIDTIMISIIVAIS